MADRKPDQTAVMDKPADKQAVSTADLAKAGVRQTQVNPVAGLAEPGKQAQVPDAQVSLLPSNELDQFRGCWQSIQTGFVDEPKKSVQDADALVASLMKRLAETFADERSKLEDQWNQGDNVSTEDLRLALRRYRSFFDRLLSV